MKVKEMNTKTTNQKLLLYSGIIFLALGILGNSILGPSVYSSILGDFFWLNQTENYAHLIVGLILLVSFFKLRNPLHIKLLIIFIGALSLLVSILGFLRVEFITPYIGQTWERNPSDSIMHLVLSFWIFWTILTD